MLANSACRPAVVWLHLARRGSDPPCPGTSTEMSLCSGREHAMSITNLKSGLVGHADIIPDSRSADMSGPARLVTSGQTDLLATGLKESLGRVATLAVISLRAARASVMVEGKCSFPTMSCPSGFGGQPSMFEQLMCADVAGSGHKLIIDNTRVDRRASVSDPPGPRPPEVPCAKCSGVAQRCRSSTGRKFPAMEHSKRFFVMEHP